MYRPDDGENPGLFTVTGILVSLLLGAGVFYLLYTALGSPSQPTRDVLGAAATSVAPLENLPSPTEARLPSTALPRAEVTIAPTTAPTPEPLILPTTEPIAQPTPAPVGTPKPAVEATPLTIPTPTSGPVYLRVNSNGATLNIRSAPGADSPLVEIVEDGARLLDLGETRRLDDVLWRRVRTDGRAQGWAADQFLQEE